MMWAQDQNGLPLFSTSSAEHLEWNNANGHILDQAGNQYQLQVDGTLQDNNGAVVAQPPNAVWVPLALAETAAAAAQAMAVAAAATPPATVAAAALG
jgi:hypothetical protein